MLLSYSRKFAPYLLQRSAIDKTGGDGVMGAASSSETGGENNDTAAAGPQSSNNNGFSQKEAQHLSNLRRLVCQEQQRSGESSFLSLTWKCSHLLAFADIEAQLAQQSRELVQNRRQRLEVLSTEFPLLNKINTALEKLFTISADQFMVVVSNILGMHGGSLHQKDSLDFIWNAFNCGDESVLAKDVVELCFHMASASQYIILQGPINDGTMELLERRNVSAEQIVIKSMTNSLLEYAKYSRDNHGFGGCTDPGATNMSTPSETIAEGTITKREFSEWQRKVVPDLFICSVAKFLHVLLFPPEFFQSQHQAAKPFPILRSAKEITSQTTVKMKEGGIMPISSHIFGENPTTLLSPPLFAFASISVPKFGHEWYRIFAGADDGWTFQSLEHSIMGYEGPTLLVIQARSKEKNNNETVTLGAYTASKWEKNKRDFFGTADCFLFQLQPTLHVLKPLPKRGTKGGHYMYFRSNTNVNMSNPSKNDDLPLGLGFGGTVRKPRLFIDSHLEECHIAYQDTSFEEGNLGLPKSEDRFSSQFYSSSLHIDSLEIYAVGDEETIRSGFKAQYQHRDIADATLRNARTVDKAAFLGDMRNGVIESKAFAHRGQIDGRAHGCLKGEDGK